MASLKQTEQRIDVSLVVPAFNEEQRISQTLTKILEFFIKQTYTWELIVVDDGSQDQTAAKANSILSKANVPATLIRNDVNKGKGYAIKCGMLAARGEHSFFTDADMSTPVEEINKSLKFLERADVVVGSRALNDSNILIRQKRHREIMGRFFNRAVHVMAVSGIQDTQCGFKGFKKQAAQKIFALQSINGYGFDVEVLYIANKLGHKIVEIPITWSNSATSRVRPMRDGFGMLGDLARIRINDIKGLYGHPRPRGQRD